MLENKIRKFVLRKGLLPGGPFLFSGILLLLYCWLRAYRIPITHDEAGTILNFASQSVRDILLYKDPIPNNHLLNTLLIKGFVSLMGYAEWICRLPAMLGGLIFFFYSYKLSLKFFPDDWFLGLAFWVVLNGNPYILEFFSLARGYGLATGLMMASIYFTVLAWNHEKIWRWSFVWAIFAVWANLTLLNYLIPLYSLLVVWLIVHKKSWHYAIEPSLWMIVAGVVWLVPVIKMMQTDQFVYWGNLGFYRETVQPLVRSSLQNQSYLGNNTAFIFEMGIGLAVLITIFRILFYSLRKATFQFGILLAWLFLGAVFYNILQHYLFSIPYLNARTAIFYYPLFVVGTLAWPPGIYTKIWRSFIFGMAFFSILHLSRTANLTASFEWWFDADTKTVLERIHANTEREHSSWPIRLRTNWLYQPSFTYYLKTQNHKGIEAPPYTKAIDTSEVYDYYYITNEDQFQFLQSYYHIDTSFAWNSRLLLKKN
jgi:hypothetical protein